MRGERAEGVRDGAGEVGGMDVRTYDQEMSFIFFFRFRTVYFYKVEREEGGLHRRQGVGFVSAYVSRGRNRGTGMAAGGLHVEEVASACTARVCTNVRGESALVCKGVSFLRAQCVRYMYERRARWVWTRKGGWAVRRGSL